MRRVHTLLALIVWCALLAQPSTAATTSQQSRRENSVVMDVDFTEEAQGGGTDVLTIVGTIQLILDRLAARTAPRDKWGDPRSIIWLPVTAQRECQNAGDTAILEISVARFVSYSRQWVMIGHQHSEVDLAFRLVDCAGRELLRFPHSDATYAQADFSPYFVSISGTAAVVALATAHASDIGVAAIIGAVNSYGALQANVGQHDPQDAQELALFRLVGNIPGQNVPPPAPGTVASVLSACRFFGQPGGHIALTCPSSYASRN
jgi:hypothetical protein